jgi:periplasmic protein CpxP/Spy
MNRFDTRRAARATLLAAALAVAVSGTTAFAQTNDAGSAPAAHSKHMHGGDPLVGTLMHLRGQLGLDSSQQTAWDNAVAQAKSARAQGATLRQGVKSTYQAEIAKDQPDMAAVATAADAAQSQGQALRKTVRDAWLNVYANLNGTQKAMVATALREREAKMEAWRAQRGVQQ